MADSISLKLDGIDELKKALAELPQKIRTKAVRSALRQGAKVIQAAAKANAPVLSYPRKGRKPGTVRQAIMVRASKFARQDGNEGVFVGVKPLRTKKLLRKRRQGRRLSKAEQKRLSLGVEGANNPNDPYYWWWVELGHRIVPRAAAESGQGSRLYRQSLRDGRVVTRLAKFNTQSLRARRRSSTRSVQGRRFITRAANDKGPQAINTFMKAVVPQIEKLNRKGS